MSKTPLVSVIMPTYHQPQYIETSILGIMAQTYPHIELIIVRVEGDQETRKTLNTLDPNFTFRTVVSQKASIIHQINLGLAEAHGDYTTLIASDDFMLPGKIAGEMRLAQEKNAVLVYPLFLYADEHLCLTGAPKLPEFSYETLVRRNYITDNSLVAKSMFEEFGPFDESLEILAVYDKWLHIAEKYPDRIVHYPIPTFIYRMHPGQAHDERLKTRNFDLYRKVVEASLRRKGITPRDVKFEITEA
jgi:glycosyltransferase involved in cell wall biosynthesis